MLYYERTARRKGFRLIAGIDEAGRGPLAGPVVAAAVILKTTRFKNRIDDSKKLTHLERASAFTEISSKAFTGLGIVSERLIDYTSIIDATRLAMKLALADLVLKPDFVLIDGHVNLDIDIPKQEIIRGDGKSLSIASASIVAKVLRDRLMEIYHIIYPKYGFNEHKGYGTPLHLKALESFGPCSIHRNSFYPVAALKGRSKRA